ncbi:MAG: hypothetical protein LJE61_10505 [Thiocapsa sp.]|jgi:hypothetical protein|nr:hypothetical protein [Thiocapsa sp.]MCG6985610.1 hypothetical protein [Thiocapsa sp.]
MTRSILRPLSLSALAAGALAGTPLPVLAADTEGDWQYSAACYLWAAGIQGETAGGAEVSLLYRHVAWDFDSGDVLDHIAFSGPLLAAASRL